MKMTIENAETVRIDGYTTFVVGFTGATVETFATAFNAAFANKAAGNIYNMIAFVGNATEDTNIAIEEGYLTEGDRIPEIISLISQFGEFDDELFEKTIDTAVNSAIMGTRKANKLSTDRGFIMEKLHIVIVDGLKVWVKGIISEANVTIAKDLKTGRFVSPKLAKAALLKVYAPYNSSALNAFRELNKVWAEKLQAFARHAAAMSNHCVKYGYVSRQKSYDKAVTATLATLARMGWALV